MSDVSSIPLRREWIVSGRVQGVAFRAATQREALGLGLRGRASNLASGCVHVAAMGSVCALDALEHWLQHGPPQAQVARLHRVPEAQWSSVPSTDHEGFEIC